MISQQNDVRFFDALIPILGLLLVLIYGLVLQPKLFGNGEMSLEIIFLFAITISVINLKRLGIRWGLIEKNVVKKLSEALPAFFILFGIGILIGSWIVSGTVPMMIYYGIKIINPNYIYLVAFLVPAIFSTLTGTSWGSAGTIGVVIMGIASVIDANLSIVAGAIVGGSYLGDKMSPLSDTTNMASIATGVPLYDHIRSMVNTTVPAALLSSLVYFLLGFIFSTSSTSVDMSQVNATLYSLKAIYNWNILLVIPIIIVLYGSITKKPTMPTLIISAISAGLLALIFQKFTFVNILDCFKTGFKTEMITWTENITPEIRRLLVRGGLYDLITAITTALFVFFYIGTLESINAMKIVVDRVFSFAKTRRSIILSSQAATAVTNSLTSNQHATSFIIGGAFGVKYDEQNIPRRVLSRTIEDFGTMWESMLPWTTTGLYMAKTLGVSVVSYAPWQFLSLFNFIIAIILASTGIGCFYHLVDKHKK
ncbi:MAG: Na+/H+ antiporter NhaC [Fusobacteriaceae bacterium]